MCFPETKVSFKLHPGQLMLKACLHKLMKPQNLMPHWSHWCAVLRQEALLEPLDYAALAAASGVCEAFWQHTQNFYLDKPARGNPIELLKRLDREDLLQRLYHMAGYTHCLWDMAVLASYFAPKVVNQCIKGCDPAYRKQLSATLLMLRLYPAFLQHAEASPCVQVYTDGGLHHKRAAWAFHIPELNLTQSRVARGVKKSNEG